MTTNVARTPTASPTLGIVNASKTFAGIRVLDQVSFRIDAGQVCALIGQNGSGKSTLIKILSGFHHADPGLEVTMAGADVSRDLTSSADRTGLAFIHQDLALVPSMTILENLRINRFTTGPGWRIRWQYERDTVSSTLARVGLRVDPDTPVGELSVTEKALVAIARGLAEIERTEHEGQLLVLDEPTAYLPRDGVERLFHVIRGLTAEGVSILFVSHRLDEVMDHCDRVLVLRHGRLVADEALTGHDHRSLVELMLGRVSDDLYPSRTVPLAAAEPCLEVVDLHGPSCRGISFSAAEGEIVGFAGLPGGGYDEIPYLLAGAILASSGELTLGGQRFDAGGQHPGPALRRGIALLPADRKGASGAVTLNAGENLTLPSLGRFARGRAVLRRRAERRAVQLELDRFKVQPSRGDLALEHMSGGNQQKVLLAKWLMAGPRVLALHEPTQGVDLGAKREIFAQLAAIAREGQAILISSVEYDDLANLCDRVHIVQDGRIVSSVAGAELTGSAIAAAVYA